MAAEIKVSGLRELGAAFRAIDRESGKAFSRGMKSIVEPIVGAIRGKVPGGAGAAVKARGGARGASIAFPGGEDTGTYDFYPWLDFGGSVGKGHRIRQPWSGSVERERVEGGRYIYPTIAEHGQQIEDAVGELVLELARHEGFTLK